MRPLNTRERRIQFTRFLLLFLLAVLPIVTLVWLHGRVDHVENDFLREHYQAQLEEQLDQDKFNKALGDVTGSADRLIQLINDKNGDLLQMSVRRVDGEIKNKVLDLDKAITGFQNFSAGGGANKAVSDVATVLRQCATSLQEVYVEGYVNIGKQADELKTCNTERERIEKKLETCERSQALQ